MDNDYAGLQALISAVGGMASTKKKPKLAPGGVAPARPAPSKIRSQDGISDSDFIQQIIQAAQQMSGGALPPMTMSNGPMPMAPQQPQQPPMAPQQPGDSGQMGGLAGLLGALGGGQ